MMLALTKSLALMTITEMVVKMMEIARRLGPVSSAGLDGSVGVDILVVELCWRARGHVRRGARAGLVA